MEARREEQEFEAIEPAMPERLLAMWRGGAAAYARFQAEFHSAGALTPAAKAPRLEFRMQSKTSAKMVSRWRCLEVGFGFGGVRGHLADA